MSYLEMMGVDYPPFQLDAERREWLRKHGTITDGEISVEPGETQGEILDGDTICYYGMDEAVRRERGMRAIESTPAWVCESIVNHARAKYAQRETAIWPDTVWDVKSGIKAVLSMNRVDDEIMPLEDRKALLNYGAPLISRFLIRENPEYGETHFIGIRRRKSDVPDSVRAESENPSYGGGAPRGYVLDDYLFPELRDITADTETAPFATDEASGEDND